MEISASGPLFGYDLLASRGAVRDVEEAFLAATEVELEAFNTPPTKLKGVRRPLRIPISEPAVEAGADEAGAYLQIGFALPKGSFATTILREIMKTARPDYPWGSERDATTCRAPNEAPKKTGFHRRGIVKRSRS